MSVHDELFDYDKAISNLQTRKQTTINMPLTISIDLDKTWTADPWMFSWLARFAKDLGHTVIICTRRTELSHEERIALQIPEFVTLFFASYGFKRDAVPFPVDIWIDDEPGTIEPQRLLEEPDAASL